jgi:dolichol-phosphate mannosyltransferase
MIPSLNWQPRLYRLITWLKGFRYLKFGLVGASGTLVNMAVLFLAQEYFFASISNPRQRLYASLALAIAIATVNNFTWNRLWTWGDRVKAAQARQQHLDRTRWQVLGGQLGRYALASWLGIGLQYGLTLWLAHSLHYLLANVIAIVVASVSNFLANDHWTFGHRTPK